MFIFLRRDFGLWIDGEFGAEKLVNFLTLTLSLSVIQ